MGTSGERRASNHTVVRTRGCSLLGLLSLACAGTLDDDGLEFADAAPPAASSPELADVADDARSSGPEPPEHAPCLNIVAALDLDERPTHDASLVCTAREHVEHTAGFSGTTTPLRRAYECLLDDGHAHVVHALVGADEPTVRAFAYESLDLEDAWTLERIELALAETSTVTTYGGCVGRDLALQTFGVGAANRWPNRPEVAPLLAAWAADASPQLLAIGYAERGDEAWVDTARAREIYDDPDLDDGTRAAAAIALAHHGEPVDADRLTEWARGVQDHRFHAIRALHVAGHAEAWAMLRDELAYVPSELLVLGAHLAPDDAVPVIDRQGGLDSTLALPPRLRDPRLGTLVCRYSAVRALDPSFARKYRPQIVAALEAASPEDRCAALDSTKAPCDATVLQRNAFALSPSLVEACGHEAPPPLEVSAPDELYDPCDRDRAADPDPYAAYREAHERERVLELERRARKALKSAPQEE